MNALQTRNKHNVTFLLMLVYQPNFQIFWDVAIDSIALTTHDTNTIIIYIVNNTNKT